MTLIDANCYTYTVKWSPDDGEFVATVAEFPSLSFLGNSQESALLNLRTVVENSLIDMQEHKEPIPAPHWTKRPQAVNEAVRRASDRDIGLRRDALTMAITAYHGNPLSDIIKAAAGFEKYLTSGKDES